MKAIFRGVPTALDEQDLQAAPGKLASDRDPSGSRTDDGNIRPEHGAIRDRLCVLIRHPNRLNACARSREGNRRADLLITSSPVAIR